MQCVGTPRLVKFFTAALGTLCAVTLVASAQDQSNPPAEPKSQACPNNDSDLKLPPGFCATIFADQVGHARHMAVAPSGVVYVNTWSGEYYGNDTPHAGGFLVALQDTSGAGKANVVERFGETLQSGGAGGTGIGMYKSSIFAEINDRIVRYSPACGLHCAEGCSGHGRFGVALRRRSSDASVHHRCQRNDVCGRGEREQFLPAKKSHIEIPGRRSLRGAGDARRHLAVRREQNEPDFFEGRPFCDRNPQWRRLCHRCRRPHVCDPTRTRSVAFELAGFLQAGPGGDTACRRGAAVEAGRRLRMARMLLRRVRAKTDSGAGIWWGWEEDRCMRRQARTGGGFSRALGTGRHGALQREAISEALSRRRIYRVSRIVEPGAVSAGV